MLDLNTLLDYGLIFFGLTAASLYTGLKLEVKFVFPWNTGLATFFSFFLGVVPAVFNLFLEVHRVLGPCFI